MKSRMAPLAAFFASAAALYPLRADEGMWTFDNPPAAQLENKYRFTPTKQWLDHVRLSSVRLNDGGSGSFISPHGLLLTNHHVARGQLQKSSTAEHDYIATGFYAATEDQEIKAPDLEVNVLISTEDVTSRVGNALKGVASAEQEGAKRRAVIADIERESEKATGLRSDVVSLYQGGEYWLYRYKRYTDVRIVFAPEQQIAFYGGDPDNFTYPRYDLDMALFRVYENGKPIDSANYLKWNPLGAKDGDLVFVSGHPGSTQRLDTLAQLVFERDVIEPDVLKFIRSRIAALKAYSNRGAEQAREASSLIFGLENGLKLYEGREKGLKDPQVMAAKERDENDFKARIMANPEWKRDYGSAWDDIAQAERKAASRMKEQFFHSTDSELSLIAMHIVQYVKEIKKPDGERLPGYHEAQLQSLRLELFSPAPIYPELEIARMAAALKLDVSEVGPDDPFIKIALDGKTPDQAAAYYVRGTKLADPAFRKQLVEGGEAAVEASTDTEIVLARRLDPIRRESIKWFQDNVQSVESRGGELLGRARFAAYGKTTYPDATFTLRLSYGQVKGYPMNGTVAPSHTTFYGLYDRANGFDFKGPFALPARYREAQSKLNLATPFDFATTNDVVGGNSGSPVVNREGEIVGLIFDGNIESLVGDFVYDETSNRSVAVATNAMTEALRKLYGAEKLIREITGQ